MSKFGISPEREAALISKMEQLGIREEDLLERFIRGTGAGGQKINKTSSTVQLTHLPSGLEIKCQRERSQALNRYAARLQLCKKLEEIRRSERELRKRRAYRLKRARRKRSPGEKEQMLHDKRHRSQKKLRRGKVSSTDG